MPRPKAKVLLTMFDGCERRTKEVLHAPELFAVFYDGMPISYREINGHVGYVNVDGEQPRKSRYKRFFFPYESSARNVARKMNKMFDTDKFAVYRLGAAEKIK